MEEGGERFRAYLQDETEYTRQYLKDRLRHLKSFRKRIREASQPKKEFPEVWWPYEYWAEPSTADPDDQAFYRKDLSNPEAEAQLLVDTGTLEDDFGQTGVGGIKLSPCQRYMVMLTEFEKGSESYTINVLDLQNEKVMEDDMVFPDVSGCEWSNDSKKVVYTTHDDRNRPNKVWVHVLGTSKSDDVCLMEETDSRYYLHVGTTKNRRFIVITAASKMASEVHLLDGKVETPYSLRLVQERTSGLEYYVECWSDNLVILSNNTKSSNYTLSLCSIDACQQDQWKVILPENDNFVIEDLEMTNKNCMLLTRDINGHSLKCIAIEDKDTNVIDIPTPDWCRQITLGTNLDFSSEKFSFFASSPVHQSQPFEYHFDSMQCKTITSTTENLGFDSNQYTCQTEVCNAEDGTQVPITIAFKNGRERNGENPCLLEVYGAYGHALDMGFQPHRIPLLDHGWIIALGHIRGGGELGRLWHKQGRLENKSNSISDCVFVMKHLINKGYTTPGHFALETFSAGGVVAGAIINHYPNMLLAAILQVPFVDILTVLTDEEQPLTIHEYEEWGNPKTPSDFSNIKALCPYQNVKQNNFPSILVNCGFNDSRVPIWGPAKWVAKIKENQKGEGKILLHTDFEGGHFSSESERNALRDLQYTFLMFLWEQYNNSKKKVETKASMSQVS
eukprot:g445.t1